MFALAVLGYVLLSLLCVLFDVGGGALSFILDVGRGVAGGRLHRLHCLLGRLAKVVFDLAGGFSQGLFEGVGMLARLVLEGGRGLLLVSGADNGVTALTVPAPVQPESYPPGGTPVGDAAAAAVADVVMVDTDTYTDSVAQRR